MKKAALPAALLALAALSAACSSPAANTNANTAANTTASPAANANNSNASSSASDSAAQDFTLVNQTGVEIDKVFISPHDADDWEEDILGKDTLPTGQSVDIKFQREETAAQWDLRVEDKQGNAIEWENLNLLKISKVTLHYKDKKPTAEVE